HAQLAACRLTDLDHEAARDCDIVIHATSMSLAGQAPELPAQIFERVRLAYDLSYADGPAQTSTAFLRLARRAGAAMTADGLGMLVEQAAEAFFVWRGIQPET